MGFLKRLLGLQDDRPSPPGSPPEPAPLLIPTHAKVPILDACDYDPVQVVGESFHQEALERIAGGRTPDGPVRREHVAALVPEPTNPYDANAISVQIEAQPIGHLSREDAIRFRPVFTLAKARGYPALGCHAALKGGWDRGGEDQGSIGVELHMAGPAGLILEWDDGTDREVKPRIDHQWVGLRIAFTGDSGYSLNGVQLDRSAMCWLALRAGMTTHPRVTKKVQLLVDCDPTGVTGNQQKAEEYGIPVVSEADFWAALGVDVQGSIGAPRARPVRPGPVAHPPVDMPPPPAPRDLGDLTGKAVCFTGESVCTVGGVPISRASQEILATNAGLLVLPRVTKKLDLLVVSPLVERTGKVARAEEYGIALVDEPTFWRAIGVRID
jgi:hypothetical protein